MSSLFYYSLFFSFFIYIFQLSYVLSRCRTFSSVAPFFLVPFCWFLLKQFIQLKCYLVSIILFLTWSMQRGFDQQWLSLTFSKAIFLGNGLVAILSGLFGNLLVDSFSLGPVAPFDAAACFLAIGMAVILSSWTENYGDPSESKDLLSQFRGAAVAIASGKGRY